MAGPFVTCCIMMQRVVLCPESVCFSTAGMLFSGGVIPSNAGPLRVVASEFDPTMTRFSGEGLTLATAGVRRCFMIQARDRYFNDAELPSSSGFSVYIDRTAMTGNAVLIDESGCSDKGYPLSGAAIEKSGRRSAAYAFGNPVAPPFRFALPRALARAIRSEHRVRTGTHARAAAHLWSTWR
jgi:hypothetical protein